MDENIFSTIDKIIADTGTDDPIAVAENKGILAILINGSIKGYASLYHGIPAIGINVVLNALWYKFTGWHELGHVFDGHIYEDTSGRGLVDFECCAQEVDSLIIPRHEKIANLISANVCVKDEDVLTITNYDSQLMSSYRRLRAYQEHLVQEAEALRFSCYWNNASSLLKTQIHDLKHKINNVSQSLANMEMEINATNCCKTFHEMASELGVNERILRYKLEAMRMRGYDIDPQELETYNKMFDGAMPKNSNDY